MNTLNYKNSFNTTEKIRYFEEQSSSINLEWDRFFTKNYAQYVSNSISSSFKIYKSFLASDITAQSAYILTKSIYDEFFYTLYGKNFVTNLYTSSIQQQSFDVITNVYFNPDQFEFILPVGEYSNVTQLYSNRDEYRLCDIVYGNYNGSGSTNGDIIVYDNAIKSFDFSYPSKAVYNELKQISTALEEINPSKIKISSSIDDVFALNFSSNHIYDGIAKKSFELTLCKMNGSASIDLLKPQLNINFLGTNGITDPNLRRLSYSERELYSFIELSNLSENLSNSVKSSYIVSGSLTSGVYYKDNKPEIYGKIFYDQGLVILDSQKLNTLLNLNLQTGSNLNSNNSLRLFKSIDAALGYFWIITDGVPDLSNPYYPNIGTRILQYVTNVVNTPKLNIKQEINSIFYRCKIDSHEFNYSTNPTYYDERDGSLTIKKFYSGSSLFYVKPETYITAIGLYDSIYNLVAVAKISKALRKSFNNSLIINVRLDY